MEASLEMLIFNSSAVPLTLKLPEPVVKSSKAPFAEVKLPFKTAFAAALPAKTTLASLFKVI